MLKHKYEAKDLSDFFQQNIKRGTSLNNNGVKARAKRGLL